VFLVDLFTGAAGRDAHMQGEAAKLRAGSCLKSSTGRRSALVEPLEQITDHRAQLGEAVERRSRRRPMSQRSTISSSDPPAGLPTAAGPICQSNCIFAPLPGS
jgi:hypothetical protein